MIRLDVQRVLRTWFFRSRLRADAGVPFVLARACLSTLILVGAACDRGEATEVALGLLERDAYDLVADASEPVVALEVEEGDLVAAGDALLRQDGTLTRLRVREAEHRVAQAAARLADLQRGARVQQIAAAKARSTAARVELDRAEREFARARKLVGVVAAKQQQDAESAVAAAQAQKREADAVLADLRAGNTDEQLAQARAEVEIAQNALHEIDIRVDRLVLRAPVDGRVESLPYRVGERPPAGGRVVRMLEGGAPHARVYIPEAHRTRIHPGDEVALHVDGVQETLRGVVRTVAHDAAFTPYYALTERDRGRLAYLTLIDVVGDGVEGLPAGLPVRVDLDSVVTPAPKAQVASGTHADVKRPEASGESVGVPEDADAGEADAGE